MPRHASKVLVGTPLHGVARLKVASVANASSAQRIPEEPELPSNVVPLRPVEQPAESTERSWVHHGLGIPEWPLLLVLTCVGISLVIVLLDSFRRGAVALATSLVLAFFLRLVLPDSEAGLLKVRGRVVDLIVLGALALGLLLSALWVPAPN